ncbi:MAG: RNA 2',3'-cyclic phosphodiesterase [bacterium]
MKIRSFLAFDIPPKMQAELGSIIGLLSQKTHDVKWVKTELMHCTLRFFGEVEEELLTGKLSQVIEREVRHQAPIHLFGHGIGVFPNWRYPRVLWAGLAGDTEAVISLHAKLEETFEELGLHRDPRALRLHLTLGRARSSLKDCEPLVHLVEKLAEREFGEVDVNALTLYKSVLTREGPVYTALQTFPLGTSSGRPSQDTTTRKGVSHE